MNYIENNLDDKTWRVNPSDHIHILSQHASTTTKGCRRRLESGSTTKLHIIWEALYLVIPGMIEFCSLGTCNSVLWFYSCRSLKEAFNIVINFCVQNRASFVADIQFYLFIFFTWQCFYSLFDNKLALLGKWTYSLLL